MPGARPFSKPKVPAFHRLPLRLQRYTWFIMKTPVSSVLVATGRKSRDSLSVGWGVGGFLGGCLGSHLKLAFGRWRMVFPKREVVLVLDLRDAKAWI